MISMRWGVGGWDGLGALDDLVTSVCLLCGPLPPCHAFACCIGAGDWRGRGWGRGGRFFGRGRGGGDYDQSPPHGYERGSPRWDGVRLLGLVCVSLWGVKSGAA